MTTMVDVMRLIMGIGALISGGTGLFFLIKYKKTQNKNFLLLGIIFTLFIGALIFMLLTGFPTSVIIYGPPPTDLQIHNIKTE